MTVLLPFCVASSALVAVTVIVFGVGRIAGAVYIPFASIVPTVALPPAIEFTDHVTVLFAMPLTVAANASFAPARIVAVEGVTVIPVPLLPSSAPVANRRCRVLCRGLSSRSATILGVPPARSRSFHGHAPIGPRQQTPLRTIAATRVAAIRIAASTSITGLGVAAWVQ